MVLAVRRQGGHALLRWGDSMRCAHREGCGVRQACSVDEGGHGQRACHWRRRRCVIGGASSWSASL